ncbi:MAG: hypothetical protein EON93_17570 [Burkholderiales bacterium]|nr:MAG: hypothetical protein EON93_17570 [Burkholderiales bacterium]
MRLTGIALGAAVALGGCGGGERAELADVNARNALDKAQSAYSRTEDLELQVQELEARMEEMEQRME